MVGLLVDSDFSWQGFLARFGVATFGLHMKYGVPLLILKVVISKCANIGHLQHGMDFHGYSIFNGFESNVLVGNALIDMYGKCRRVNNASWLFDKMPKEM
jgi:hypothetical protein